MIAARWYNRSMKVDNQYVNSEISAPELESRVEAAQTWIQDIETITDTTQDTEAERLLNGVLNKAAVARPDKEKDTVFLQGYEQPTIFLIPLFREDRDISDTTRIIMGEHASQIARYTENTPGRIYFNAETPLTSLLKGILILHEAKHAELFETNQFREGNELDWWYEEAAVFDFEFRLLNRLIGKPYEDLITNTALRLAMDNNSSSDLKADPPQAILPGIDTLDEIFGSESSPQELSLRNFIVWLNAVFRILERSRPSAVNQDKAWFLQRVYENIR